MAFEKTVEESYVIEYIVVEERNLYYGKDRHYNQAIYIGTDGFC